MSAITDADRAVAEQLLRDIWFECGKKPRDPSGGVEQVAQAIADAREAENKACEDIARMLPQTPRASVARAIADRIAARRSR